jgi:hypothetical protein
MGASREDPIFIDAPASFPLRRTTPMELTTNSPHLANASGVPYVPHPKAIPRYLFAPASGAIASE